MGIIARGGSSPPSRTIPSLAGLRLVALLSLLFMGGCTGPAAVVERAVEAARAGDRQAYEACFTKRSRATLRALWRASEAAGAGPALGAGAVRLGDSQWLTPGEAWQPRVVVPVTEGEQHIGVVLHSEALTWRIDLYDTERTLTGIRTPF